MSEIEKSELYEEKFLVINVKRLQELNEVAPATDRMGVATFNREHEANKNLLEAIKDWKEAYESDTGKKLNQKYLVINQDEPYANQVWDIIEKHEASNE